MVSWPLTAVGRTRHSNSELLSAAKLSIQVVTLSSLLLFEHCELAWYVGQFWSSRRNRPSSFWCQFRCTAIQALCVLLGLSTASSQRPPPSLISSSTRWKHSMRAVQLRSSLRNSWWAASSRRCGPSQTCRLGARTRKGRSRVCDAERGCPQSQRMSVVRPI